MIEDFGMSIARFISVCCVLFLRKKKDHELPLSLSLSSVEYYDDIIRGCYVLFV